MYPRELISDQTPLNPITEDFLMNPRPNPVMFDPKTLLSILESSSRSDWLCRETEYWLNSKIEFDAINPRQHLSW